MITPHIMTPEQLMYWLYKNTCEWCDGHGTIVEGNLDDVGDPRECKSCDNGLKFESEQYLPTVTNLSEPH